MGINEEIVELNKRLAALVKKQGEFKSLLAVEEHKAAELTASLKEDGIDVVGKNDEELETLSAELMESLVSSKDDFAASIAKAEKLFAKLDALR